MAVRCPRNPRVEEGRGFLATAQQAYEGAERRWRNVLESQSGSLAWRAGASEQLAFLAATLGQYRQGEQHLDEALSALRQREVATQRLITWWVATRGSGLLGWLEKAADHADTAFDALSLTLSRDGRLTHARRAQYSPARECLSPA